jgi:hypothetical protein
MTVVRHSLAPTPYGCRWCGIPQREHAQRWKPPAGWHTWEQPTNAQIKARMLARRTSTQETR